jgi:hypothetical protein
VAGGTPSNFLENLVVRQGVGRNSDARLRAASRAQGRKRGMSGTGRTWTISCQVPKLNFLLEVAEKMDKIVGRVCNKIGVQSAILKL